MALEKGIASLVEAFRVAPSRGGVRISRTADGLLPTLIGIPLCALRALSQNYFCLATMFWYAKSLWLFTWPQ